MNQSLIEHAKITKSILEGNCEDAEEDMKTHVSIQGEKFSDMASSLASVT